MARLNPVLTKVCRIWNHSYAMKGVITGGLGTRLYPLTFATNKHLLPVYDKPMIFYPIDTLVKAGIEDILIVDGGPHAGHFMRVLKNGGELGIKHLQFMFQEDEGGIAQALSLAEDFSDDQNICVILGDNCTDTDIKDSISNFKDGAFVHLKKVPDPENFGVPIFNSDKEIVNIVEKPRKPASRYAVTSPYIYDDTVFDKIRTLRPSKRGELEITDLNNLYLREGKLRWRELKGLAGCGYF